MSDRLEKLLAAVNVTFRFAEDEKRAERLLAAALRALVNPALPVARVLHMTDPAPTDALGAPLSLPKPDADLTLPMPDKEWDDLRTAVRFVASEIGWPAAARRFGGNAKTLQDLVYRSRVPSVGRKTRLLRVVASNGVVRH